MVVGRAGVRSRAARRTPTRGVSRSPAPLAGVLLAGVLIAGVLIASEGWAQATAPGATTHLAAAESAFVAERPQAAEREYAAVIALDPANSRAVFRLAQLRRRRPGEAVRLHRQYVALERHDPWGYIALGDALLRAGRRDEAIAQFDTAVRMAPDERDARVGRARALAAAGRTGASIDAYERWTATHPDDAEAWRELGERLCQVERVREGAEALARALAIAPDPAGRRRLTELRARATPAIEAVVGGGYDSDGTRTRRLGVSGSLVGSGGLRAGLAAERAVVSDAADEVTVHEASLTTSWRARERLRLAGTAGLAQATAAPRAIGAVPVGWAAARWRPRSRATADVRIARTLLDATPLLVRNRVVSEEASGRIQLRLGHGVSLRGDGRVASIAGARDWNRRDVVSGGVVVALGRAGELTGLVQRTGFVRRSRNGYFSPRTVQHVEVGSYSELALPLGLTLVVDAGAGLQQIAPHGAPVGEWQRALRLWSQLTLPPWRGRELRLEVDHYDARVGRAPDGGAWRSGSAALSVRWPLGG